MSKARALEALDRGREARRAQRIERAHVDKLAALEEALRRLFRPSGIICTVRS